MTNCCQLGELAAVDLVASFIIGFLGSLHCLGMCGPIVLAYSLQFKDQRTDPRTLKSSFFRNGFIHHLGFHSGRLLVYAFLGGAAAAFFHLAGMSQLVNRFQGWLVSFAGVLMVYFGLVFLKILHLPGFLSNSSAGKGSPLGRLVSFGIMSPGPGSKIVLGMATGFLPCGLSWAMAARSAATQNIPEGFLIMAAFGLGTVPVLFLSGLAASFFSLRIRFLGERLAACSLILLGLLLVSRGVRFLA